MIFKWFPWKWLVGRAAKRFGLIDPFMIVARLKKFAEPSEVDAPIELIRAWTVFQARGIVNTRAIQHNLDWIWPYWVERQFNPRDRSFVPRSFSLSHINLTHRDWVAVGLPDLDLYSVVDPRGLVTPLHDGWSLDAWLVDTHPEIIPSRSREVDQTMATDGELAVETRIDLRGNTLSSRAEMSTDRDREPVLRLEWCAKAETGGTLCVALRPYNPEGIQFVDSVEMLPDLPGWRVNRKLPVRFSDRPERLIASTYEEGDVFNRLNDPDAGGDATCSVGMATAAAMFSLQPGTERTVSVSVPLAKGVSRNTVSPTARRRPETTWRELDRRTPDLCIPDEHMRYLFRTASKTLLSLSSGEVVPGPCTYRRFWYRDACVMLNALLTLNHEECCTRALERSFPSRQTRSGFYQSQQGEWDSNGQVLWLAGRYAKLTGGSLSREVMKSIRKGAEWLRRKRLPETPGKPHAGLLPPGFSAEHLGPNNYLLLGQFLGCRRPPGGRSPVPPGRGRRVLPKPVAAGGQLRECCHGQP